MARVLILWSLIHAKKPGEKEKFVFSKPDGKIETVEFTTAPRSKFRDDEDFEASKKEFLKNWLTKKKEAAEQSTFKLPHPSLFQG